MSDKESITQIDHETVMGKIIYLFRQRGKKRAGERKRVFHH